AGIRSLKIEGRLKSPEYVAAITKAYRRAVDAAWDAFAKGADADRAALQIRQEEDYAMQMTFSRGLHTGWLRGIDNQQLVHARFGKKRGAYLGTVVDVVRRDGRAIRVRVNDRGPFVRGRIIDVSTTAARALGILQLGVAHVVIE
ncbi:U32 family peptidase, partial [uncultured Synechococcus sp.]|uniref:U32 family peptidase n=1 Tax=uncultured Synechococcus sp. TaxID=154535 RepID=UPI002599A95C